MHLQRVTLPERQNDAPHRQANRFRVYIHTHTHTRKRVYIFVIIMFYIYMCVYITCGKFAHLLPGSPGFGTIRNERRKQENEIERMILCKNGKTSSLGDRYFLRRRCWGELTAFFRHNLTITMYAQCHCKVTEMLPLAR